MAADAEVIVEGGALGGDSPVLEPSSPNNTSPTSEKNENENFNSEKSGETDEGNGVKDSDSNSNEDSKSEFQMKEFVDMLKKLKLNPQAKEFFPSSYYYGQMGDYNFELSDNNNLGNDGFPNNQRRRNNYSSGKRRMSGRAFRAQREDSIRRTVYVYDINQNVRKAMARERIYVEAHLFNGGESGDGSK